MKKIFIYSALFFIIANAQEGDHFLQANQWYEQREYEKAIQEYTLVEPKTGEIWYNVGNCYYALEQYAQALTCWYRASSLIKSPFIDHNIAMMKKQLQKQETVSYKESIYIWIRAMGVYGILLLQIIFLCFWYWLIASLYKKKISSGILCSIGVLFWGSVLGVYYIQSKNKLGVIKNENSKIFVGPNEHYHSLGVLSQADTVIIEDMYEQWYRIRYNEMRGWVAADAVSLV